MATYTTNYNLTKPTMAELADIRTINGNMDEIDEVMHGSQASLAPPYDSNETWNTGDVCMYELLLYECDDDNVTGVWNPAKWHRTYAAKSGGSQTYTDFVGATSSTDGAHGLVPAPLAGDEEKFLKADGTWAEVAGGGGGGGASTIVDESVQIAGGAAAYQCTHTIADYDMIGFTWEGASEIHWTNINKTASFDCYLGDISNVNTSNQYALTQGKITVNPVNNTVENVYSTMFHYDGSSYQNTYSNRKIVKLYFAKISGGGGSNQKTYLVEGVGKNAGTVAAGGCKDIATGVNVDSADEEYIGYLMRYSGNPHLVISNVWIDNNLEINVTLFNPTGTAYSVDSATGVWFTVITGTSSGGGVLVDYSTDEQSTGQKWVDGRTIYQKTLEFSNLVIGSGVGFYHHIDNLREMVKLEIAGSMPTQTDYACGAIVGLQSAYINSGGFMTVNTNSSWDASSARTWYFTIYYTKVD